jgi:DNA-binding NarL/FixJ family response regulator
MKDFTMKNKRFLAIDSQVGLLLTLEEEILSGFPECHLDMATTLEDGRQLMLMVTYDLVILDIMSSPGSNLLDLILSRKFPVLVLSDNVTSPEALSQFHGLRIKAFLHKKDLDNIVPTIEQVLTLGCD